MFIEVKSALCAFLVGELFIVYLEEIFKYKLLKETCQLIAGKSNVIAR